MKEVETFETEAQIPQSSSLLSLNPFLDEAKLLRVGGRESNSKLRYENQHPLIIHGMHPLTKLLILNTFVYCTLVPLSSQHHSAINFVLLDVRKLSDQSHVAVSLVDPSPQNLNLR